MTVGERINHVQAFTARMKARRDEVVRLLMWEIGKTLKDAGKEFDRTVAYIEDTVDALKDLDRISSRFTIAEGIIGQIRRAPLGVALCMGPYNYPLNESLHHAHSGTHHGQHRGAETAAPRGAPVSPAARSVPRRLPAGGGQHALRHGADGRPRR